MKSTIPNRHGNGKACEGKVGWGCEEFASSDGMWGEEDLTAAVASVLSRMRRERMYKMTWARALLTAWGECFPVLISSGRKKV